LPLFAHPNLFPPSHAHHICWGMPHSIPIHSIPSYLIRSKQSD
jgi:hypothetical protein